MVLSNKSIGKEVYINVVLDKSMLNVNLNDYLVLIFKIETRHCFVSIVMFKISFLACLGYL